MCEIVLRRRRWAICRADNAMREMEREAERGRRGERTLSRKSGKALSSVTTLEEFKTQLTSLSSPSSLNGLTSLTAAISGWKKNENNGITIIALATLVLCGEERRFLLSGERCGEGVLKRA